jgi:Calx-beta domain
MPKTGRCGRVSIALTSVVSSLLILAGLPASAQIQGYGKDATGGAGGSTCTVTTSAASGTGSWDSCIAKGGNQTIQFAVPSAVVRQTQYVRSNTTIDGCANGQNGVTLDESAGSGRSVIIEGPASNVIVRCMRFVGSGVTSEGSDLLSLDGTGGLISRVAVDRSTFVASPDGALDITGDISDVTVQNSLFYGTTLTQLIKYYTRTRLSLHHNVYTAGGERNPQIKGDVTKLDFVSNIVHANTLTVDSYGTLLWNGNSSSDSPGNIQTNMVANAYVGTNGTIKITTESGASASGIYIASSNYCSPTSNCPSSPAATPFTVATGYEVTPTLPGCMVANMLPNVGAPNRTATDTLKINAVAAALPNTCGAVTPSLSIADASVTEGNAGTTTANFAVTLSAVASGTVTVSYATANGTATAGSDYVATSGTLTFAAGTITKTIPVTVNGDTTGEPNETFLVNLSAPSGATLADSQATGTIVNDDTVPTLSMGSMSMSEGNSGTKAATLAVTLSAPSASPVTVTYAT